ncbi:MAG TPA: phospholipase D-like domain-containing protein [Methanocorpusculum sp.]|nr:phospholipase D-like domain-containing protein [Methanocorpusculum sp.]
MKKLPKASILISVFILLLFLAVPAGAAYTITEFCPDGYASGDGDEYFVLEGTGDLSEWSVTDGEGTVSFPGGSGKVVAARSAAAYYDVFGTYPDYEIIDSVSFVPEAVVSGKFQMANTEDSLTLLYRGTAVQSVSWPDEVARGAGRIHLYENGAWDSRVMKIGQSRLSPASYSADKVTLFVSPDCSYQVLTGVIADAKTSIDISMYEFTHPELACALSDALSRGVTVRILMEGGPVGGISDAEKGVLDYLGRAGAEVYVISGTSEYPARYRYLHTKYLIADSYVTAVLSENFKESGIPVTGQEGNRGWGAVIYDSEVAAYFSSVFSADISGKDISRRSTGSASFPALLTSAAYTPVFDPVTVYNVEVTPVFAPDTSYLIPNLIAGADSSVIIQQAYITKYPDLDENPWLTLAVNAAKAGADVRVQLDAMYYNTQDDEDNDELAAELNRADIPTLSARLLTDRDGISKIHNKGMIVDGRYVLVSSINWNYNSPNNNRESAVIIDSPEAAAYFTRVFDYDWDGYVLDNPASYSLGFDVRFLIGGIIIAGGIVFVIIRRRKR